VVSRGGKPVFGLRIWPNFLFAYNFFVYGYFEIFFGL
jgi:hypothetical protein